MKKQSNFIFTLYLRVLSIVFLVAFSIKATVAAEDVEVLTQAQWNVPRSAITIVNMPPLQKTIQKYQAVKGSRIQIKYAGGDEGTLWVYELRGWLISLGVPARHIELQPGASSPEQLELTVLKHELTSTHVNTNKQPDRQSTFKHD